MGFASFIATISKLTWWSLSRMERLINKELATPLGLSDKTAPLTLEITYSDILVQ